VSLSPSPASAKAIYPDRFADIDPDAVRREYAEQFGIGDEKGVEWFFPQFETVNGSVTKANITGRWNIVGECKDFLN
jgi:hypothetical protein